MSRTDWRPVLRICSVRRKEERKNEKIDPCPTLCSLEEDGRVSLFTLFQGGSCLTHVQGSVGDPFVVGTAIHSC